MPDSEHDYRAVLQASDDGFCVIELVFDAVGRPVDYVFVEINPAFVKHTGFQDALGRSVRSYVPDHDACWFELYGRVVRTGQSARAEYHEVNMGRWYETFATPFGAREQHRVAVVFRDITEHKRHEQARERTLRMENAARLEAEAAGRLKDEFLATLSHELRTPLHAMLGWLTILRTMSLSDERRAHALAIVERNARAQAQLVEDLLEVGRVLSDARQLELTPVELSALLEAALDDARPVADKKEITLHAHVEPQLRVLGDGHRLTLVLRNLLDNAFKFTPSGGQVGVRAEAVGSDVQIEVRDSGHGIAPEFMSRVFERFEQGETGISRRFGGLGLGLSIVKQLVELHGGSVGVESEGLDRGTVVRLRLPRTTRRLGEPAQPSADADLVGPEARAEGEGARAGARRER